MEPRRSYKVALTVNDRRINEVVIDPHFEEKHAESISDDLILALVQKLNGGIFLPDVRDGEFQYFKTEPLELAGKRYRLIWLLRQDCMYIGVVNAFRRP